MKPDVNTIAWKYFIKYKAGHLYNKLTKERISYRCPNGRCYVNFGEDSYLAARVIWILHNGKIPKGFVIDHVDGHTDDDHIGNLRLVTPTQNTWNTDHAKFSGVRTHAAYFSASIHINGVRRKLGKFDTEAEAHAAYIAAAKLFKGEFFRSTAPEDS